MTYAPNIFLYVCRPVYWAPGSTADDAGPRAIPEAVSLWASRPPLRLETQVEKADLSDGHWGCTDTGLCLSGNVSDKPFNCSSLY